MKKLICFLLTLALLLTLAPAGMGENPKPAPSLVATVEYCFVGDLGIFDPDGRLLGYVGTISGDIEGDISWWVVVPTKIVGQTNHYVTKWEVYDPTGVLIMAGYDAGVTTVRHGNNSVWRENGTVIEANAEFESWIGRHVHQEGHFTWDPATGFPDEGWGTFRVN